MRINFHPRGDDDYQNRLLSYLKKQIPFEVYDIIPIRNHVLVVKSSTGSFVLKGYSNLLRLELQKEFTESLKKRGFHSTYEFLPILQGKSLYFKNNYYGALEYIEPADIPFSYQSESDRIEGIQLIGEFHKKTSELVPSFSNRLSHFSLLRKWKERLALFVKNLPVLSYYLNPQIIKELVSWAEFSLEGMEKHPSFMNKEENVILHGDVAHHNFLREKTGKLYLIDFDLISIGPPCFDFLQYANRILPTIDWSYEHLISYEPFTDYIKQTGFVFALIYPSDILREWNRLVRQKAYFSVERVSQVNELTFRKLELRKQFIQNLKNVVK